MTLINLKILKVEGRREIGNPDAIDGNETLFRGFV